MTFQTIQNDLSNLTKTAEAARKGAAVEVPDNSQAKLLAEFEAKIAKGLKGFLLAAPAIWEIFHGNLFRSKYKSFALYMRTKWEMDSTMAGRYRDAGKVLSKLSTFEKLPQNEGQCRLLTKLTDDDLQAVWSAVCESEEKITAELIEKTIKAVVSSQNDGDGESTGTTTKEIVGKILIGSGDAAESVEISGKDIPSILRSLAKVGKFGQSRKIVIEW